MASGPSWRRRRPRHKSSPFVLALHCRRNLLFSPAMTHMMSRLTVVIALVIGGACAASAQGPSITIRAARVIDGTGKVRTDATVVLQGSRTVRVDRRSGPATYDLGGVTLMPGMIDVHVHI